MRFFNSEYDLSMLLFAFTAILFLTIHFHSAEPKSPVFDHISSPLNSLSSGAPSPIPIKERIIAEPLPLYRGETPLVTPLPLGNGNFATKNLSSL